jgi:hypothetical protein
VLVGELLVCVPRYGEDTFPTKKEVFEALVGGMCGVQCGGDLQEPKCRSELLYRVLLLL